GWRDDPIQRIARSGRELPVGRHRRGTRGIVQRCDEVRDVAVVLGADVLSGELLDAQAQIERQVRTGRPVVLKVLGGLIRVKVLRNLPGRLRVAARQPEQEICRPVSGRAAGEIERALLIRNRIRVVLARTDERKSCGQRMAARLMLEIVANGKYWIQ